nr:NUDIX domain-containing protein [Kibdelosporangium phytohabitans]
MSGGRILGTRSRGNDVYYLPGGKREPGETDIDTLAREIMEELTVTIDRSTAAHLGTFQAQAHGKADGVLVRMTCYTADHDGTPTASNEIAEVAWLTYSDRDRVAAVDQIIFDHLHGDGRLT